MEFSARSLQTCTVSAQWSVAVAFIIDKEVLKLGELSATVRNAEPLPPWVGPLLMILGGALAGAALLRGR